MTCHDFQRKWHELLDADAAERATSAGLHATGTGPGRDPVDDESEALLLSHAADCPACRPIAVRYQTLRQAIRGWRQPPVPPDDLVQRILSAPADIRLRILVAGRVRSLLRAHQPVVLLTGLVAASLLLALLLPAINQMLDSKRTNPPGNVPVGPVVDLHSVPGPVEPSADRWVLNRALAEATSATLELARTASEPAARISHDMLDSSERAAEVTVNPPAEPTPAATAGPDEGPVRLSVSLPSLDPLTSEGTSASEVLHQVGDRLSEGAAPISSTARHAFGFLLGSPAGRAGPPAARATPTGA
jgi:hypothetical protein